MTAARKVSQAKRSLATMTEPIVVYPFRYRDPRTKRWVKARYMATPDEIAARYAEWEITGPGEERWPLAGYFNPARTVGKR